MRRNTETGYGSVAKWLHWLPAFLVMVAYLLVLYVEYVLGGVSFGIFAIPGFGEMAFGSWVLDLLGLTFEQWEVPFDLFHYYIVGPYILWVIIAAHVSAALYHHYIKKDDVLKRMLR